MQVGKKPAALPKDMDASDSEEEADVEIVIPEHKIKLIVGAGGDKIKHIQRKSKCRIQVRAVTLVYLDNNHRFASTSSQHRPSSATCDWVALE